MTKQEVLKIIEQNKDILTPENLQGILKDIDLFTEAEWEGIASYLQMTHELMKVSQKHLKKENEIYRQMEEGMKTANMTLKKEMRTETQAIEKKESENDKFQSDQLISNL